MAATESLSVQRTSPPSAKAPSAQPSVQSSVAKLEDSLVRASRMRGGAAAAPRLKLEFSSRGTSNRVGAPQGPLPPCGIAMVGPQGIYLTPGASVVSSSGSIPAQAEPERGKGNGMDHFPGR